VKTEEVVVTEPVTVPLDISAELLSAGIDYTCAATLLGEVRCWGPDEEWFEQDLILDDGVEVSQLETGYMGWCVVLSNGESRCELLYGKSGPTNWPVEVGSVTLAASHGCLLDVHGKIGCWGDNHQGQLGQSVPACPTSLAKTSVVLPVTTKDFVTGPAHSCAIDEAGLMDCWGFRDAGNYSDTHDPFWPDLTSPLPNDEWKTLDIAGDQAICSWGGPGLCAVTESGKAFCSPACPVGSFGVWTQVGTNFPVAQVGCGVMGPEAVLSWEGEVIAVSDWSPGKPIALADALAEGYSRVKCGVGGCCATDELKGALCWGPEVPFGAPDAVDQGEQKHVALKGTDVAVGETHACVLTAIGEVLCWGNNLECELGLSGGPDKSAVTTLVPLPAGAVAIAAGSFHTCAGLEDGRVYCWGWMNEQSNDSFWGPGPPDCQPVLAGQFDKPIRFLVADIAHTIAVNDGGEVWFAGCNDFGVVPGGVPTYSDSPLPMSLP
jgi:hypothetical protein